MCILLQLDRIAVVECDDGMLVQTCKGGNKNTMCNEILNVQKMNNNLGCCATCYTANVNGEQAEATRENNYNK